MDLRTEEDRWAVWMVQARKFAERENFLDAVARMKLARDAVRSAVSQATNATERARLEALLARANEELETMQSQCEAWRSRIAARRQNTIDEAAEEMARPLPVTSD